jgi:hypothetical protein
MEMLFEEGNGCREMFREDTFILRRSFFVCGTIDVCLKSKSLD